MIKSASLVAIKLPFLSGVQIQAGQAHHRDVRKEIQTMRRYRGPQPSVCLSPLRPISTHKALAMHRP